MKVQKLSNGWYSIKLEKSDNIMKNLGDFAKREEIGFAQFWALGGGITDVTQAFSIGYDDGYKTENLKGPLEILNATGCIAWDHDDQSKPAVHCHATFADENFNVTGGHIIQAKEGQTNENVGLTVELYMKTFKFKGGKKVTRKKDPNVNVKLLNFPDEELIDIESGNKLPESGKGRLLMISAIVIGVIALAVAIFALISVRKK